jgi:hypothetical protein
MQVYPSEFPIPQPIKSSILPNRPRSRGFAALAVALFGALGLLALWRRRYVTKVETVPALRGEVAVPEAAQAPQNANPLPAGVQLVPVLAPNGQIVYQPAVPSSQVAGPISGSISDGDSGSQTIFGYLVSFIWSIARFAIIVLTLGLALILPWPLSFTAFLLVAAAGYARRQSILKSQSTDRRWWTPGACAPR